MKGTVIKLNFLKQFVWIAGNDQRSYFGHFNHFEDAFLPCDESLIGVRVVFDSAPGRPGKGPRAINVMADTIGNGLARGDIQPTNAEALVEG